MPSRVDPEITATRVKAASAEFRRMPIAPDSAWLRAKKYLVLATGRGDRQVRLWKSTDKIRRNFLGVNLIGSTLDTVSGDLTGADPGDYVRALLGLGIISEIVQCPAPGHNPYLLEHAFSHLREALQKIEEYRDWEVEPYLSFAWYRIQLTHRKGYVAGGLQGAWIVRVQYFSSLAYSPDWDALDADYQIADKIPAWSTRVPVHGGRWAP